MNVYKRKSSAMQTEQPRPLLEMFAFLFYICKALGINPLDWEAFRRYKQLKHSPTGCGLVIVGIIIAIVNFNLMIFMLGSKIYIAEKSPLSIGIGFVLTYYTLALLVSDGVNTLLQQNQFMNIFKNLEEIDGDLSDLNIFLNNNHVKHRLMVGIFLTTFAEAITFIMTFALFVDSVNWTSALWVYSYIPSFLNSLDKLWYIGLLIAIRKRFESINKAIDKQALNMERERLKQNMLKTAKKFKKDKEMRKFIFKNQISPVPENFPAIFGDVITSPTIVSTLFVKPYTDSSTTTDSLYANLEDRFVKFCQLHDTLCNVAKQLNNVYAFPVLMLMGYGFFVIIAQLYFFYAANVDQKIPPMFRPAQSWWITAVYIFYISSKCGCILYVNWLTSLESKKTGVCIHRCAMAADKDETYEMINHLSLKLFNHPCNFNACGYFPLNMTTLFSFCGGITTYLIILIQFNLEEQQVKIQTENGKLTAVMQNETQANFIVKDVVSITRTENDTSLFRLFYQMWNTFSNEM